MEKEIFFLFNPDAPEIILDKKEKYRSVLPQAAPAKRPEKKASSLKLHATLRKVFCSTWWN
ncbi:hypothetical protein [Adhaeribacter rhizoryzae]|uniref:Uncharacterized protein n=1 Tax=Adhaeribacter rhizoryzae TaxID=2607907 RepID=A0A5M6DGP1_9BACT|nr:hypothetical protein [Adhaeribacter rhizoryzae]KAA5546717.1 hypothetical protein F0145_10275 [Adhaeribacter rhizoryzae]